MGFHIFQTLAELLSFCDILNSKVRADIYIRISQDSQSLSGLAAETKYPTSTVQYHLNKLIESGFVRQKETGAKGEIFYAAVHPIWVVNENEDIEKDSQHLIEDLGKSHLHELDKLGLERHKDVLVSLGRKCAGSAITVPRLKQYLLLRAASMAAEQLEPTAEKELEATVKDWKEFLSKKREQRFLEEFRGR